MFGNKTSCQTLKLPIIRKVVTFCVPSKRPAQINSALAFLINYNCPTARG